jgi:hypothetical protein
MRPHYFLARRIRALLIHPGWRPRGHPRHKTIAPVAAAMLASRWKTIILAAWQKRFPARKLLGHL